MKNLKGETVMRYNLRHLLLAIMTLTLAALTALSVRAQNPTGSIRGTVTDEQGAVIQKATITVTNKSTGDVRKLTAGDDGAYSVENLLPGDYEIKVEASGFSTVSETATVLVGNSTTGNVVLRVGGGNVVVDITSEAPVIDKTDYKIDGVIERQEIDALPLNGRNFLQLALIEPGVSVSTKNPGSQNNLFNVSIGGGNSALTRLTVDGGNIVDPVCGGAAQNFSTETIQEFQISSFNFDLSTGVTAVGAINIVSRTGTNQYHGSGFMFVRDSSFAAVPTLQRDPADPDPFFRRWQYGGSFGGPIKKDRAWFFTNVERLDQNSAVDPVISYSGPSSVLSALQKFQTTTTSPYKGTLGNVRADFKLNDKNNLFARYSRDDNSVFGPTNSNALASNWRANSSVDDNIQGGWTWVPNNAIVNDLRFNFQHIVNNESIPTASQCPPSNISCTGLGGPEILMLNSDLTLGNNPNAFQARDLMRYETTDNVSWQRGTHRFKFGGEWEHDYGTGHWAFANPAAVEVFDPGTVAEVNAEIAGISALPPAVKAAITLPLSPAFFTPGATPTYQDILNLPMIEGEFGQGNPAQPPPFHESDAASANRFRGYAQDQWQARPGLTLSYGLSYTFETNLQNYDLAKGDFLTPLLGTSGQPSKYHGDFAPAVGFAWDVGNKGKTVVRGGAGLYYDTILFVTRLQERAVIGPAGNGRVLLPTNFLQNTIPFPQFGLPSPLNLLTPLTGVPLAFTVIPTQFTLADLLSELGAQTAGLQSTLNAAGAAGFNSISVLKTALGAGALDPKLQVPYSLQYTFGIQHQFKANLALSADFVFRRNDHGLMETDYNLFSAPVGAYPGHSVIPICATSAQRANPGAECSNGSFDVVQSSDRSTYEALLVKLDKRFANRYQFTASYALSSLVGYQFEQPSQPTGTGPVSNSCWFCQSGNLDADARHRFTFAGVVDLPKGFQGSIIATFSSAPPMTAFLGSNIDLQGDGLFSSSLPGIAPNSLGRGTSMSQFIAAVNNFNKNFAGTATPNGTTIPSLTLPSHFSFGSTDQSEDIRVTKVFKFRERANLQVFAEIFNIFNIGNLEYGSGAEQVGTSFGVPTGRVGQGFGTGGPRALQFGTRFSF
jgi:hypothetical protein